MSSSKQTSEKPGAFRLVMIWSGIIFFVAILFGLLYRVIYPIELHLDEDKFMYRVFVETETSAWQKPAVHSTLVGIYNAGSILYVIDENEEYILVRPFIISKVDSVWVPKDSTSIYTDTDYERYLYEEERKRYNID